MRDPRWHRRRHHGIWRFAVPLIVVVVIGLTCYWISARSDDEAGTSAGRGTVYSVADGDTLTVLSDGRKVKIRVLGIDAPEIAHGAEPADCGGPQAAAAASTMLPVGSPVTWATDPISDQKDVYGRVLAYVATSDIPDVGLALIEQGLVEAWVPSGEPHPTRWGGYIAAQRTAHDGDVGSWAACRTLGRQ
jgi:micrococcal nuclease